VENGGAAPVVPVAAALFVRAGGSGRARRGGPVCAPGRLHSCWRRQLWF